MKFCDCFFTITLFLVIIDHLWILWAVWDLRFYQDLMSIATIGIISGCMKILTGFTEALLALDFIDDLKILIFFLDALFFDGFEGLKSWVYL